MKILWLLSFFTLHAADSEWTQAMQRARDLQNAGNYTNAEIVMTGGGQGPLATPFKFTLQNASFV